LEPKVRTEEQTSRSNIQKTKQAPGSPNHRGKETQENARKKKEKKKGDGPSKRSQDGFPSLRKEKGGDFPHPDKKKC